MDHTSYHEDVLSTEICAAKTLGSDVVSQQSESFAFSKSTHRRPLGSAAGQQRPRASRLKPVRDSGGYECLRQTCDKATDKLEIIGGNR